MAALVVAGRKRATVSHGQDSRPGEAGTQWVVTAASRPVAVVETVRVERRRFCDIDSAFARLEGEGDLSLQFWRREHEAFFREIGVFLADMPLWYEEFRLVAVPDAGLAERAAAHVAAEEAEARQA